MSDTVFCGHVEIVDPMARRCVDAIWRGKPDDLIEARTMLDGILERALEKQAQEDAQRTHYGFEEIKDEKPAFIGVDLAKEPDYQVYGVRNKGCMTFGRIESDE